MTEESSKPVHYFALHITGLSGPSYVKSSSTLQEFVAYIEKTAWANLGASMVRSSSILIVEDIVTMRTSARRGAEFLEKAAADILKGA